MRNGLLSDTRLTCLPPSRLRRLALLSPPRLRAFPGAPREARGAGQRPIADDGDDDVRERWPCVIQIVLRRTGRMIRMGMIKPEQFSTKFTGALLCQPIIRRP